MLTGQENLELVGRLYHLGPGERGSGPGGQFQLADAADRPVRTYSAARSGGPARTRPSSSPAIAVGPTPGAAGEKGAGSRPGSPGRARMVTPGTGTVRVIQRVITRPRVQPD
jgi:ABC-2 type transport system ATP-binding protein